MHPVVYHYSEPRSFLLDTLKSKKKRNPLFSVRAWSKQMGFKCHSSLALLCSGRRKVRPEHVEKLAKGLRLSENEEKYFRALVHFRNARTATEREYHENQLRVLYPAQGFSILEVERFRLVADWIHMAILEMTRLKDFKPLPEWIEGRLCLPVGPQQVRDAITRLINLGLLTRRDGTLLKTKERLTTPKDFPSECIREHHKQVLANAIQAIDDQSVNERIFNSCAMTIDSSKLEEAKALIRKFREDMSKCLEKDGGDQTYQLNVGFYRLTGPKARPISPE